MSRFVPLTISAYELAKQQRKNFGEDITSAVRYAKKKVGGNE